MKRSILSIIGVCAGLLFAVNVSAIGFGTDVEQSQNQTGINKSVNLNGNANKNKMGDNSVVFNESDRVEYDGTFRVKNTPNLGSIPLATSSASFTNGTCYGAVGGQGTIAGTGAGFSTTVEDKKCSLRYLAALAANLGSKADGLRVACLEPDMLKANPSLCNEVYDKGIIKTTAGTSIDLTYRPKNDLAINNNGFISGI